MSKVTRGIVLALYCIALWFTFDFIYSNAIFTTPDAGGLTPRTQSKIYHHGLRPNFAGQDTWGPFRYRFVTNSLGLRDAAVRDVPMKFEGRRIVLIGDSFTEGTGVAFEDSFAGLLALSASARQRKLEFLNAGVLSYSPLIYHKRIKHLLDSGVEFDEVVVLPDISDVQDEATDYFCIDDDPKYRQYCVEQSSVGIDRRSFLSNFVVTHRTQSMVKHAIVEWRGGNKARVLNRLARSGWTIPGFQVGRQFDPLGVDGGIARGVQNMQALADLLKSRGIPMTVAVYPWPMQLARGDRDSRQVAIWRDFCARNCKAFIDLFPAVFAAKDAHSDWYERLFIVGDVHFSVEGNKLLFHELAKHLLPGSSTGQAEHEPETDDRAAAGGGR